MNISLADLTTLLDLYLFYHMQGVFGWFNRFSHMLVIYLGILRVILALGLPLSQMPNDPIMT